MDARAGYDATEVAIEVEGAAEAATLEGITRISESRCLVPGNLADITPLSMKTVKIGQAAYSGHYLLGRGAVS